MKHEYKVLPFLAILLLAFIFVLPPNVKVAQAEEPPADEPTPIQPPLNLWKELKQYFLWDLEWFDSADWISKKSLLGVIWDYPNETAAKFSLNFTSEDAGAYRLSIAINLKVKGFVNRTNLFHYNLTFEGYSIIFDWNDLKEIPGLAFKHGVKDGYFWFRIRHNDVPANKNLLLDPTVIFWGGAYWINRYENQIKTFRNPRGTQWHYAMAFYRYVPNSTIRLYSSENGTSTWNFIAYIDAEAGVLWYDSSSLWIYDNGTALIVYFVWAELAAGNIGIHYRRGVIADSNYTIALEPIQQLASGNFIRPVITLAEDGYLWVTATKIAGGTENHDVDGYNEVVCDWTKSGSSPYLQPGLGDYVYTSGRNDEVYEFTFENNTNKPSSVALWVKGEGDGDDYVECYLHDGTSWSSNYDITPPVVAAFEYVDVSAFLDTDAKIDAAKLKLIKQTSKSANDLYVYEADLRVTSGWSYNLTCLASDVAYEPTSSDWSSVETVFSSVDEGEYGWLYSTIAPLSSGYDAIIGFRNNETGSPRVSVVEGDWNGASFTFQTVENLSFPVTSGGWTNYLRSCIRVAVDSNNLVHIAAVNNTNPAYCNYTVDSGFSNVQQVSSKDIVSVSMSIDLSHADNRICIIYSESGGGLEIYYKRETVGEIDFPNAAEITIFETHGHLYHLSASYRDVDGKAQATYSTGSGFLVIWVRMNISFYTDFYFYEGGTIRVNGTITANGTRNYYVPSEAINITTVPSYSYSFLNHTYDSSSTTNNPFYLTVNQDYTIHTYFYFVFDCNYIGMNSTIAGDPVLFSANWTDLYDAEGLDYFQFLTNNTGVWVGGSWSDSWRSTVWADAEYTLNDTAGLVIAFRSSANNTDGATYNSTICFFTTQSTGGNTSAWTLAVLAVGALIAIPCVATVYLIVRRK